MRKNILKLVLTALLIYVSTGSTAIAKSALKYKKAHLSYVDLSDSAQVTAYPIITQKVKLNKGTTTSSPIIVELNTILHPKLSGLGGAFNEQGGEAFMSLQEADRNTVAEALFSSTKGAGFSLCRTAVGASDFGLSAYSYSEIPNDYNMEHFTVERDTKTVIPFILAGKAVNPDLKIFASPWSPPGWMKVSGKMTGGYRGNTENVLKSDPAIYDAYALYFSKYVQEYGNLGVNIDRLIIQNETDMNPSYPGCNMLPEQMAELISHHIRPQFMKDKIKTEIWAGSFRDVNQEYARPDAHNFMKLEGAKDVVGVGLQYCPAKTMVKLRENHPGIKMMHTEGNCENGENNMKQARKRFSEVAKWLNGGLDNYCYWNMVLNEEGKSAWGWRQNCLITIDRQTGQVTYNPDFAPIALLSHYIRPGDQCIKVNTPKDITAIAVRNPERLVVFLQNNANSLTNRSISINGAVYTVDLPANSLCAYILE